MFKLLSSSAMSPRCQTGYLLLSSGQAVEPAEGLHIEYLHVLLAFKRHVMVLSSTCPPVHVAAIPLPEGALTCSSSPTVSLHHIKVLRRLRSSPTALTPCSLWLDNCRVASSDYLFVVDLKFDYFRFG